MDYSTWHYYQDNGVNVGIISPDNTTCKLLIDPDVAAWISAGGQPLPA